MPRLYNSAASSQPNH